MAFFIKKLKNLKNILLQTYPSIKLIKIMNKCCWILAVDGADGQ